MNIQEIIRGMTLREKLAFCTGADFWHTKAMPEFRVLIGGSLFRRENGGSLYSWPAEHRHL